MDTDDGKIVGSVFLDFKKAFDLLDHKTSLYKLKLHHFTDKAYKLFNSYLNGRCQLIKNAPWYRKCNHYHLVFLKARF